jgi:serine/threonine protein kinase/ABC-type phosphate/phosphonate transport system substrate-binding protein
MPRLPNSNPAFGGTDQLSRSCPKCLRPVPPDAPAGHCPSCLLALAGEEESPTDVWPEPALAGADRRFGDYVLGRQIGAGGMGVVYEAFQESLRRPVALKLIRDVHVASPTDLCRFTLEAEAAARLEHPNIVRIHEVGECSDHPFISMDLVEGESLQAKIARGELVLARGAGTMSSPEARRRQQETIARLMAKTARAVHHAHDRGVLHRDLKPGNILIDRQGEPHLTDFGLAKILEQPREERGPISLTAPGDFLGTPSYMSPEQVSGLKTTRASDVYGLGAVLYELLTGRPPFEGTTTLDILRQIADHDPPKPRSRNPAIAPDLETICLKCLEKDPRHRFSSAAALAEDLEGWLAGQPIRARRASLFRRTNEWVRRNPIGTAFIAALCLGLLVALTLLKIVADQRGEIERDRNQTFDEGMDRIGIMWDDPETKEVMISASELAILADRSPVDIAQAKYHLYFGVSSGAAAASMAQRYAWWLSELQQETSAVLGETVVFRMKLFKLFNEDEYSLAQGDADLMLLSAVDFLKAQEMAPGIVPLAREKVTREAVIFARAEAGLKQLAHLRGRKVAFPDPDLSISVWAKARLAGAGLRATDLGAWTNIADERIGTDQVVIGYRTTIYQVLGHLYDAGVTYRDRFELDRYKGKGLDLLDSFPETPAVLAARRGLDARLIQALGQVIPTLKAPSRNETLSLDLPVEMVPASDTDFAALRQAMQQADLFEGQTGAKPSPPSLEGSR